MLLWIFTYFSLLGDKASLFFSRLDGLKIWTIHDCLSEGCTLDLEIFSEQIIYQASSQKDLESKFFVLLFKMSWCCATK